MIKQKLRNISFIMNNQLYINNKDFKTSFLKHINFIKLLIKNVNIIDFEIVINNTL